MSHGLNAECQVLSASFNYKFQITNYKSAVLLRSEWGEGYTVHYFFTEVPDCFLTFTLGR